MMERELRERMTQALWEATWEEPYEDGVDIEVAFAKQQVDAILTEIASAGYVLLPDSEQRHLAALIAFVAALDAQVQFQEGGGFLVRNDADGMRQLFELRAALDAWHPR